MGEINVFSRSGRQCGTVTLEKPSELSLGLDGTLIVTETLGEEGTACGVKWWPAMFK